MIKEFSRKYAVLYAFIVSVLYIAFLAGISSLLNFVTEKLCPDIDEYIVFLVQELIGAAVALVILKYTGFWSVLKNKGVGLLRGIGTGAYFIFAAIISAPALLYTYQGERIFRSPVMIAVFVLAMIFVGISEEIVFRGVVTTTLYNKFAGSKGDVWKTVTLSGCFFGIAHLVNLAGGINPVGVLVQVIVASVMGMVLSAVYLRSGSILTNIILHALIDIGAGITSIYVGNNIAQTIGGYSSINLLGIIPYVIVLLVLLRKKKIGTIRANFADILDAPPSEPEPAEI